MAPPCGAQLPVGSGLGLVGSPAGEEGSVQVQRGRLAPGRQGGKDSQPLTGPRDEQAGEGSQDGTAPRGGCGAGRPLWEDPGLSCRRSEV